MGGITSGVGIFSGINTAQIIDQLMAIESRPKTAVQNRILSLQAKSGGYLDLNSRLSALQAAAQAFRNNNVFQTRRAVSSNSDVLSATASGTAPAGTYTFIVDRLVSTQQQLSRGFATSDQTGIGLTSLTFEPAQARLDRDVSLSDLNDGEGVQRGRIIITDSTNNTATVDLSRATSVQEVLDAINSNGTADVRASLSGGRFVITDAAGGTVNVSNAPGSTMATSLGIAGSASGTLNGQVVYRLNSTTTLASLNDGNGVGIKNIGGTGPYNFIINIAGPTRASVNVYLGETRDAQQQVTQAAATTAGDAVSRINQALQAAGVQGVTASIDQTNGRFLITDSSGQQTVTVTEGTGSTAADLGLANAPVNGSIIGTRLFAGLNTTLARGLNGGAGLTGDGVLHITARDGAAFNVTIDTTASLADIFAQVQAASGTGTNGQPRITLALDSNGTGIKLTDNTGGSGNLIVTGNSGNDTAASMKVSTGDTGVSAASVGSGNLQRRYMSRATLLSTLNSGRGVGSGTIRVTDSLGAIQTFNIGASQRTLGDVIDLINGAGLSARARVNANGDGIEIYENAPGGGPVKIKIEDASGSVALNLNIRGEAAGVNADNKINGTFEKALSFQAGDTLQQIVSKINGGRAGVTASIVRDGSGTTPYRLNLTSSQSGEAGRFLVDAGSFDMAWQSLEAGRDSRAFFGSSDPARGVVLGGSTNSIDGAVTGLSLDLRAPSDTPVSVTVSTDTGAIESAINAFITAFNTAVDRIDFQTRYDSDSQQTGPLLGDSTAIQMKQSLYAAIQGTPVGETGRYQRLSQVGIVVGEGGHLTFDQDAFRGAMAEDPQAVESLFSARVQDDDSRIEISPGVFIRNPNPGQSFSTLGIMGVTDQLIKRYIDPVDGVLIRRGQGITDQIELQNKRIDALDLRLSAKRAQLEKQFAAMEQAIQQLQSQQGTLGSIGSIR